MLLRLSQLRVCFLRLTLILLILFSLLVLRVAFSGSFPFSPSFASLSFKDGFLIEPVGAHCALPPKPGHDWPNGHPSPCR